VLNKPLTVLGRSFRPGESSYLGYRTPPQGARRIGWTARPSAFDVVLGIGFLCSIIVGAVKMADVMYVAF
jgi:hypothetical protein